MGDEQKRTCPSICTFTAASKPKRLYTALDSVIVCTLSRNPMPAVEPSRPTDSMELTSTHLSPIGWEVHHKL